MYAEARIRARVLHEENNKTMKIPKNSLMLAAAFTGLVGGTTTRLNAASAPSAQGVTISALNPTGQWAADDKTDKKADKKADKDKNSCKGNDGCGAADEKRDDAKKKS
jgi:hypothetical protein